MRRFLFILICCVLASCENKEDVLLNEILFTNNDERLINYYTVNDTQRESCFIEEFDDNSSQFPYPIGIYTDAEVCIANSKMTINFFVDSGYIHFMSIPIEIDEKRNFEMETSLIIYRNDSVWHTFAWLPNQLGTDNIYTIDYEQHKDSKDKTIGMITLWKKFADRHWERIEGYDFNEKSFHNSSEFTVLTIRKIGDKYAIFINHKLFYIINDKNFSYIPTITMVENVINVFDYFRVYYLP